MGEANAKQRHDNKYGRYSGAAPVAAHSGSANCRYQYAILVNGKVYGETIIGIYTRVYNFSYYFCGHIFNIWRNFRWTKSPIPCLTKVSGPIGSIC